MLEDACGTCQYKSYNGNASSTGSNRHEPMVAQVVVIETDALAVAAAVVLLLARVRRTRQVEQEDEEEDEDEDEDEDDDYYTTVGPIPPP